MGEYKKYVIDRLNSYKCKSTRDEWRCLPIYDEKGQLLGFLKPVTLFYRNVHPQYISLLYKWRVENQEGFHDEFEHDLEKTENWFDNILLPREDRLLFFIHSADSFDIIIGHIGVSSFDFEKRSCEIDNVVRGFKKGSPGIMSYSTRTIITWIKNILDTQDIFIRVFSDNHHAIKFYEKNNFVKLYDIPTEGRKAELFHTYMKLKDEQ